MFVTVVAVLCHLIAGGVDACHEEIITDSSMTPELSFIGCIQLGQAPIAKWKSEHPIYRKDEWHIEKYKCAAGHYVIKGEA